MRLKNISSGKSLPANIEEVNEKDQKWIKKSSEFSFNWSTEKAYEVYKIYLVEDEQKILGIMSLINRPDEYRIHLNLLEVSKSNQGSKKEIDHIAGCLIAFAAENAFKRGYYGFVSLEPKTALINHYRQKYGFSPCGRYLAIEGSVSQILIEKYPGDE